MKSRRIRGIAAVIVLFAGELVALHLSTPTDFSGLLVLNTALILWLVFQFGYTAGGLMLMFSVYFLIRWSMESTVDPVRYWAAGLVWLLPFTYIYRQRDMEKSTLDHHLFQRQRIDEEANETEHSVAEMELRLANSRHWRDRIAPLCNLAEDLLATLRPSEVTSSLLHNVPELIPSTDRFFCYRTDGMNLYEAQLLAAIPPEEMPETYSLDELDRMCYQEERPILVEDAARAPAQVDTGRPIGSVMLAPLIIRMRQELAGGGVRHTLGALRVECTRTDAFDRSDLDILNIISDVTARALHNTDLYMQTEHLAVRDALTGLLLRHIFFERATQSLSRSRRSGSSISLVMLDIDDFKKLNDTWGHTAGDLVLKRLATILQENIQPGELVCRYGGEEMALLLHQDVLRSEKRTRRLLANLAEEKYLFPDDAGEMHEVHATLSAGIAAFPLHAEDLTGLIQKADRALYRAKRLGKNRPVTARRR